MSQSKTPATCVRCECSGPQRGKPALSQGWHSYAVAGKRPAWYCPTCASIHKAERAAAFEQRMAEIRWDPQLVKLFAFTAAIS